MKKRTILIFIILILLLVILFFLLSPKKTNELVLFGNVDIRQVDLGFRTHGRVEKMMFEEGDFVAMGSFMAKIDSQPYEDELRQAKAHAASVKANFDNAVLLYNRRVDLKKTDSVSQEDLEDALAKKNSLEANYEEALASVGVAETNLKDTLIMAPTDGFILTRIREPGAIVRDSDPIYTLSIKSPVWIRAYVNEPNLGRIYPGMEAEVFTDGKKTYTGKIGFISPVAEFTPKAVETTSLRTDLVYRLRLYIDNPDLSLRQGMPVTVRFPEKAS